MDAELVKLFAQFDAALARLKESNDRLEKAVNEFIKYKGL